MADSYPCPHCGEYLEVPPELRRTPVRCASCQKVFTPGASNDVNDEVPTVGRRRGRDDFAEPRKRGSRKVLWIVIGVLLLGGLVCCGGIGFMAMKMFKPTWQPFQSAAGQFTTKFPAPPTEAASLFPDRDDQKVMEVTATRTMLGQPYEEYFITYFTLTAADKKMPTDDLLNELANKLTTIHSGTLSRPRIRISPGGHEGLEFALDIDNNTHLQARIILANNRAYIIGVNGLGKPDESPWVREFLDAFTPTEAAKK
ncbi:hypothetical protein BH11PLA2_BH11PLA2_14070 [soil metagenome]